jgi:excisionase family DNA binding protein
VADSPCPIPPAPLLTFEQTRCYLNLSETTLYRLVEGRKIPYAKIGGLLRFDPLALKAWVAAQEREPLHAWHSGRKNSKMGASRRTAGGS